MKRLLIPFVAVLALSACSKVVPAAEEQDGPAISFQVASYAAGTKADDKPPVSLAEEFDRFHTYAIFHATDPDADANQWFMEDEEVLATGTYPNITKWAPALPYYWPKTGNISFYSYAGTRHPDVWPTPETEESENSSIMFQFGSTSIDGETIIIRGIPELGKAEADPNAGSDAQAGETGADAAPEILPADNILIADRVYRYTGNVARYLVDPISPPEGVPTLFRHMLAKVRFQVVLDASDCDENTTWTLEVPEQKLLSVNNEGALYVDYPGVEDLYNWNQLLPLSDAGVRWQTVTRMENPNYQDITTDGFVLTATGERVPAVDAPEEELNNVIAVPLVDREPVCLRECVVIPQWYDHLIFNFHCDLVSTYTNEDGSTEVIRETLRIPSNPRITATMGIFTGGARARWERNHIYTYRITVKPNGEILFDPAEQSWVTEAFEYIY